MDLFNIFKCQDCGSKGAKLTQEQDTKRMICADRELCAQMQEMEKSIGT